MVKSFPNHLCLTEAIWSVIACRSFSSAFQAFRWRTAWRHTPTRSVLQESSDQKSTKKRLQVRRRGILRNFRDRKSTRLNSSHGYISYAVFCLKKKKNSPDSIVLLTHTPDTVAPHAHEL